MSSQTNQELVYGNMKKTPVKICPLSSEKLRKKLTNQSTELRKERRKNLFDKRRTNLSVNENDSSSSSTTVPFSSQHVLNQSNQSKLPTCAFSSVELSRDNDLVTIRIEEFKQDLKSKLSAAKSLEGAKELIVFISIENRNIYEFCAKEFVDYLLYKDPELMNYVNQNHIHKDPIKNLNDKSLTNYDKSIRDTIILIDKIKTDLISCLNQFNLSFIQLFFNFISSSFSFTLLTKDQQVNFVRNFTSVLSNRKLAREEIPIYKQFFSQVLDLVSVLQETDKLNSFLQSLEFWQTVIRHTEFANEVITKLNASKSDLGDFESDFQEYLLCLFDLSHFLISSLDYGLLTDSNDKYGQYIVKLLSNLNLIQSSKENLNCKSLIFFIQMLNNCFDPSDYGLTDIIVTPQFLRKLCRLTSNDLDRSLISNILGFFSNITSIDVYSFILIDAKFTDHLEQILDLSKENSNLIFYLLIIIKNMTSIDSNYFDLIFTKPVTYKLTRTFQFMNRDALNELCAIIDNCINANSNVIKQFFQPYFIESIPTLIRSNNLNLIYLLLKILKRLINQKGLKQDQLFNLITLFESTDLIDLIDNLSSNQNNAVSGLANSFLDDYYKLAEYKENLY